MKKISTISFLNIDGIPKLIKDFLTQKIPAFEEQVFNLKNVENQFQKKENSFSAAKRELLSAVLKKQHSTSSLSEKQNANLNFLTDQNTFTVTTGHQLNLFSGPVFFIYKILQTIKLADFLNEKFPARKTVPVFWMASEDHDFEEINHFKTESQYYETHAKSGGAVGNITVDDQFFITQFEEEFKDSVFGTELILLLKKAYKKGNSLSQATRILVQELFAEHGLLIIDGDDASLKAQMKDTFRNELLHQNLFETTKYTVDHLATEYGKVQVNPREINLFYLSETRNRIEFANDKYNIVDTEIKFSPEELLRELEEHPEKFSPNALMRPVYQETILPNLAYIGGNAEIMYWLELKDYFNFLALPFPLLIPRNSMLFVTEKTISKAQKLGLEIEDFFKNFAQVTKEILLKNNDLLSLLNKDESFLKEHFEELASSAEKTDPTFGNLVKAEKTRQLKSFIRMRKRLLRAEKIKQKEKLQRLENLFLTIHPGKNWQERSYNFSVFYSDYGKEWLQSCYEGIDVQNSELIIFTI
ncbi:bacillithiol biosynthesis cysteine-adding enzyme BshC [Kaistella sp. 97-N-M2]|uniref:bacillithiol biosynthesis cysteine-adding enzyme BshC n=1 Tax=Kaistella sp. 97-N-M2 TaxID=2908645 RepID=UPI001F2E3A24|nr:bacillithiol biosynthesis cysteine-adding enzyme BshC [Kaistella sp. 97-N-M2]UJF30640.1 bacillithiol biosynthesis cysteine-adding enzyme BshC [Kaistella sp. 97-N-M2]